MKDNRNNTIETKPEILHEVHDYYRTLYKGNDCMANVPIEIKHNFLTPIPHITLSDDLKQKCEGVITEDELTEVLKLTKNNKSPGIDGLPYEFYKLFWDKIRDIFLRSIQHTYDQGQLSINQRRGVVSLLPKGNKDVHYLTNWRPITLLCCDYKLISKVLATRMKTVLKYLIHPSQTGFLSDRYIGENIDTLLELIEISEEEDIPGVVISAITQFRNQ